MPGAATHFHVLERTIDQLTAAGMTDFANAMRDNPYAYLGALGPALLDFMPSDPPPEGTEPPKNYALVWKKLFAVIGGDPGLIATLRKIEELLAEVQPLADNEDCEGLVALRDSGRVGEVETLSNQFVELLGTVQTIAGEIFALISVDLKPKFCSLAQGAPPTPPNEWPPRDFFSWKKTGPFLRKLIDKAHSTGDSRLKAYAYGYLVAYATSVTGSPFVNSVVGGPPRTQWWRQRFIKNYVDAWVYGFYNTPGASMNGGDTPTPPYEDWKNLCSANLHDKINLGSIDPEQFLNNLDAPFPKVVPDDFAALWAECVSDVYGGNVPPGVAANGLNSTYLMTWLVMWFQTAVGPLGCNLKPPPGPPGTCTGEPAELDPFKFPPGGSPPPPPSPTPDVEEDTAAIVCAIILIILGGIAILAGAAAAGAVAIVIAAALLDCDNVAEIDWAGFRCKLFWFRTYMYNGLIGLQRLLSLAGFRYPEAKALGFDVNALSLAGIDLPFESAINLIKSRSGDERFPSKCWDGGVLTFNQRPTQFEKPGTAAYLTGFAYPSFFVDDPANPLANGDVKTNGGFPLRMSPQGSPVQFGNAIENAVDLFKHIATNFPSWNLDADRGLAYYTWQFKGTYDPDNVQIEPEP